MKREAFIFILIVGFSIILHAQVGVNGDGSTPDPSAMLDVKSTTRGFLAPRMTEAQKNAIELPAVGLLVYQTDNITGYYLFDGTSWFNITSRASGLQAGEMQYWNGSAWIGISAGSPGQFLQMNTSGIPQWAGNVFSEVVTGPVTNIGFMSARCEGDVTDDGGDRDIIRGFCWSTSPSPTIADSKVYSGTGEGVFTESVTNLTPATIYYVRAFAENGAGVSYGVQTSFTTLITPIIGESYLGGVLAYVYQSGDPGYVEGEFHGLIAAPSDQSTGATWGCSGTTVGSTSNALGAGLANTNAIVAACSTAGIAARLCYDLELNGYDDWFLPSLHEILKLYQNRDAIGGFDTVSGTYWNSLEGSPTQASMKEFFSGSYAFPLKTSLYRVRAIRYF